MFTGEHSEKLHFKNKLSQRPDILGALDVEGAKTDVSTETQRKIYYSACMWKIFTHIAPNDIGVVINWNDRTGPVTRVQSPTAKIKKHVCQHSKVPLIRQYRSSVYGFLMLCREL